MKAKSRDAFWPLGITVRAMLGGMGLTFALEDSAKGSIVLALFGFGLSAWLVWSAWQIESGKTAVPPWT